MATLWLVDGASWNNQQMIRPSSILSSGCHCDSFCLSADHANTKRVRPLTSTHRCGLANDLLTKLDSSLPLFPNNHSGRHLIELGPQLVLEVNPSWTQLCYEESLDGLPKPSLPDNGYRSRQFGNIADGQELEAKRNQRASPFSLSVSQSRRAMASGAVLQAASSPFQTKEMKGMSGFYVGFLTVALGLMAVLQKGGLGGNSNAPTEICTNCNGYGRRVCNLCKGNGSVMWEGKLKHTDVCPSCLGDRMKQCSECRGYRSRNVVSPTLQQILKAETSRL